MVKKQNWRVYTGFFQQNLPNSICGMMPLFTWVFKGGALVTCMCFKVN